MAISAAPNLMTLNTSQYWNLEAIALTNFPMSVNLSGLEGFNIFLIILNQRQTPWLNC